MSIYASKDAIQRQAQSNIVVAAQSAAIQQVIAEAPSDLDNNGYFDTLDITLTLNVQTPGDYKVSGRLVGSAGQFVTSYEYATWRYSTTLAAGVQPIPLHFDGKSLRQVGVNGPYTLTNLAVEYTDPNVYGALTVDTAQNLYTTGFYSATQFEGEALKILASNDAASDLNGDGLYDRLTISVTMEVLFPGDYNWFGRLVAANGSEVGWASGAGRLDSQTPMTMVFKGSQIGEAAADGPYQLSDVYLMQTSGGSTVAGFSTAHTSQFYTANQFAGAPVLSSGEEVWDTEGNGKYDLMVITMTLDIATPGDYAWNARLEGGSGYLLSNLSGLSYLDSQSVLAIEIPGTLFGNAGRNGPYSIRNFSAVYQGGGNVTEFLANAYTTAPYTFNQFEGVQPTPTPTETNTPTPTSTPVPVLIDSPQFYLSQSGFPHDIGDDPNLRVRNHDILQLNPNTGDWGWFYKGAIDPYVHPDINAVQVDGDGSILMSFSQNTTLPGITTTVTPNDVVLFIPGDAQPHQTINGSFALVLDGSDVGLDSGWEDIEGLARTPDGKLAISVNSTFDAQGVTGDGRDIFVFNATSLGENTSGSWELYFDGSDINLYSNIQNIAIDLTTGNIYIAGIAPSSSMITTSIYVCAPVALGENTACNLYAYDKDPYHNGAGQELFGYAIDAFDIKAITSATATPTPTNLPPATHTPIATDISTPTFTATPVPTATNTATDTPSIMPTATNTDTPMPTDTPSATPTATSTYMPTNTATATPSSTPASATTHITITLALDPKSNVNFQFTGSLGIFKLDDPQSDDSDAYLSSASFTVTTGSVYTVSEIVYAGWYLAGITCTPTSSVTIDLANKQVGIHTGGVDVHCTFTNQKTVSVKAYKFNDLNSNGERNTGEPWLANWEMVLYDALGVQLDSKTTNSVGQALFNSLPPGNYTVCEVMQSGWANSLPGTATPCYSLSLSPADAATVYFGNHQNVGGAGQLNPMPEQGVMIVKDYAEIEDEQAVVQLYLPLINR